MEAAAFPPNRRNQKPPDMEVAKEEKKTVEKIVTGEVLRRKKPLGRRFLDIFVSGDGKSAWHYVVFEVLVPAAKDVFADAVSQGVERIIFGEARSSSRRTGARPGGSTGYTSYNRYSTSSSAPPWRQDRREEPRHVSRRARASHDFNEIILSTRAEAEEVVENLFNLVSQYDQATLADLYDLVGVESNFTDQKWGWTDIRGAGVTRVNNGYLLDLPRTEPLD